MIELNWKDIATRLTALRNQHKLTIEELADRIDVASSFIGMVETEGFGISFENLFKISQVYNCSLDYLVTGSTIC